jgi:GNAT superfamily N-acetyltransferase
MATMQARSEILVRPLAERDLGEAARILCLAFGTFLRVPNPERFLGDADMVHSRWKAEPSAVLAAEHNGKLIGSNFLAHWGSFGFFGPLTIEPEYWNRGVAQQLLVPTMEIFKRWGTRHMGLYTFSDSPKHLALYQKFGFWPRDLVALMAKPLGETPDTVVRDRARLSAASPNDRSGLLAACREVTDANFQGLDVGIEIRAIAEQGLGDTILVWNDQKLAGFAACHTGVGSEAGSGVCYVKFAAVRPGPQAREDFVRLLGQVEAFARTAGAQKITAGVNLARREAFQAMIAAGFRNDRQGIAMETGDATSGYNRAGVFILDDWR